MRSRLVIALVLAAVGIAVYAGVVRATPPSGVTPTIYGIGKLSSFDTSGSIGTWAEDEHQGASNIWVLSNRIAPGGSLAQSHPGPSFVIVRSGTATFCLGADRGAGLTEFTLERHSWIKVVPCTSSETRAPLTS
jgi:hypothetical protein